MKQWHARPLCSVSMGSITNRQLRCSTRNVCTEPIGGKNMKQLHLCYTSPRQWGACRPSCTRCLGHMVHSTAMVYVQFCYAVSELAATATRASTCASTPPHCSVKTPARFLLGHCWKHGVVKTSSWSCTVNLLSTRYGGYRR